MFFALHTQFGVREIPLLLAGYSLSSEALSPLVLGAGCWDSPHFYSVKGIL